MINNVAKKMGGKTWFEVRVRDFEISTAYHSLMHSKKPFMKLGIFAKKSTDLGKSKEKKFLICIL